MHLPKPVVTPDEVRSWSPNPRWVADHRPDCVAAIGLVAIAWTRVEKQLTSTISGILGRASPYDDGGWGINNNWIIATAMQEAQGNPARIRIVDRTLKAILEGHPLVEEWTELKKRLDQRADDRNIIVHAEWAWSEEAPDEVIRVKKNGHLEAWTASDFTDAFDRIKALEGDLHEFMLRVLREIHEGRVRVP